MSLKRFVQSLFGGRSSDIDPELLRAQLFDAVAAGDEQLLSKLCATHEQAVLGKFRSWTRLPVDIPRDASERVAWYGQGLIGVAQHFAEVRGRPELLEGMMPKHDNPVTDWQRALGDAQSLMDAGHYVEAKGILQEALTTGERLRGSAVDRYLPLNCGHLGRCLFQLGETEAARLLCERALGLCVQQHDDEGIVAYRGCLYEIHRYLGDGAGAATHLDALAEQLQRLGRVQEAAGRRRQLAVVRAGEPLCRVVIDADGECLEQSEAVQASGDSFNFVFVRNRIPLHPSILANDRGEEAGSREEYTKALECFAEAASADRFNPWPAYGAGVTLLHLRRYPEARSSFEKTESLAPGWYQCRSDRWWADRLASGAVEHETWLALRQLEDGGPSPDQAIALAQACLKRTEQGALYHALGRALSAARRGSEAEAAYRRGLSIAEEPDIKTRLLVALASVVADPGERKALFEAGIDLGGNLVSQAMARVALARTMSVKAN